MKDFFLTVFPGGNWSDTQRSGVFTQQKQTSLEAFQSVDVMSFQQMLQRSIRQLDFGMLWAKNTTVLGYFEKWPLGWEAFLLE